MRSSHLVLAVAAVALTSMGAVTGLVPRLTPKRVVEIAKMPPVIPAKQYKVEIVGIGEAFLPLGKGEATMENGREVHFPTHFDAPHAAPDSPAVTPTTPTEFC